MSETTQEETTAGKALSRQEQARAALAGRRNKNRQVPLTQPAQSIPVSYLSDSATTQPSTETASQSSSPVLPQQSSETAMQGTPTTIGQGSTTAAPPHVENTAEQPPSIPVVKSSNLASLQQPITAATLDSTTRAPLQSNAAPSQQSNSAGIQQPIASAIPGSNIAASSQWDTPFLQQEGNTLLQSSTTALPLSRNKAATRESSSEAKYQQDTALPLQPSTAPMQSSGTAAPQQINTSASPYSVPAIPQNSRTDAQQESSLATEQGSSPTTSPPPLIAPNEYRDNAVSRYRDESTVNLPPIAGIHGSNNDTQYQSENTAALQEPSTVLPQSDRRVLPPSNIPPIQQKGTMLVQQENTAASLDRDTALGQEDDPAAAIKSMFAAVPEGAIAELMQALLVQPRVNDENKSQWRSGGMQVTYGTHKKYKLLADQYGVHMRDIVEQTLKACLPFWRAQLKHLREIGALSEEEAEDELE